MADVLIGAKIQGFDEVNAAFLKAENGLKKMGRTARKVSADLKRLGAGMSSFGKNMTAKVALPIAGAFAFAVKAMNRQVKASTQLKAALDASGTASAGAFERMKEFAAELQTVTTVGDESTIGLMQLALSMGVTEKGAMRAAKNAVVLSRAMNMSEQSAIRYTAALETGDATMLGRYIPTIKNITDKVQKAAKAQQILGRMFSVATAEAQNGLGPLQQAWNEFGDSMEIVGKDLVPAVQSLAEWISKLADAIKAWSPQGRRMALTVAALAAVIGPLIIALGLMFTLIGSSIGAVTAIAGAFSAVAIPAALVALKIGAIVAIIATVAAAFFGLTRLLVRTAEKFEAFGEIAATSFDSLKNAAKLAWAVFKGDTKEAMRLATNEVVDSSKAQAKAWKNLKGEMGNVWENVKQDGVEAMTFLGDVALDAGKAVSDGLGGAMGFVKDKMQEFIASDAFAGIVEKGGDMKDAFLGKMSELVEGVADRFFTMEDDAERAGDNVEKALTEPVKRVPTAWEKMIAAMSDSLGKWADDSAITMETWGELALATFESFKSGVGDAVGAAIVEVESMAEAMQGVLKSIAKAVISTLVQIAIQQLVNLGISVLTSTTTGASQGATAVGLAGANAYASTAQIPFIGPALAPAAAAAAIAGATSALATGGAAGKAAGAAMAAGGGLEELSSNQTVFLHKGERVLSKPQNRDFMAKLDEGGGGAPITVNLTIAGDAFFDDITLGRFERRVMDAVRKGVKRGRL